MRLILLIPLLLNFQLHAQTMSVKYLALGDSYTIGESVKPEENFPAQTIQLLKAEGILVSTSKIIAKTGWTTDELDAAIEKMKPSKNYDIVSLLIGVNNQYRGRSIKEYKKDFEMLLDKSIAFASGNSSNVFVISIPDWGVTPFAADRDSAQIAKQIDEFNEVNKTIAVKYGITYIDITPGSREAKSDPELVAGDGLHPSAKEYSKWAARLANAIKEHLAKSKN